MLNKAVELGLLEQRFKPRLRVKNPNSTDLPIRGVQYQLRLNDDDFAQAPASRG